jgi:hypothetical protein
MDEPLAAASPASSRRDDLVDRDELGMQVLELLVHRFAGIADDEELPLAVAQVPPDLARAGCQVFLLVAHHLRGRPADVARLLPSVVLFVRMRPGMAGQVPGRHLLNGLGHGSGRGFEHVRGQCKTA